MSEALAAHHGHKRVKKIERRHVRKMRDEKAETPGAANTTLRMLKILLNFAVDDGLIAASPAAKMRELPVGGVALMGRRRARRIRKALATRGNAASRLRTGALHRPTLE